MDFPELGLVDARELFRMVMSHGGFTDATGRNTPSVVKSPPLAISGAVTYAHFDGGTTVTNIDTGFTPAETLNLTVMFWFRFTNDTAVAKDAVSTLDAGAAQSYAICTFNPGGATGKIAFGVQNDSTQSATYRWASATCFDGNWHHYAGVMSNAVGTTVYLYVDGVLPGSEVTSNNPSLPSIIVNQSFWIGARRNGATIGQFFNGDIGNVQIVNAALGQAEIQKVVQETHP